MVGFIRESIEEEDTVVGQSKVKPSVNDSETFKFDFDRHSTDFDQLSLTCAQLPLDFDIFEDWIEDMQDPDQDVATKVNGCLDNHISDSSAIIYHDDIKRNGSPRDESCVRVFDHESNGKFDGLGCSIEDGLEKVSLVGNNEGLVVCVNGMKETETASIGVENDSDNDSESESESEATTSSSSSSSLSSESDDDSDDDVAGEKMNKSNEEMGDVEEGEVMGFDTEKMVSEDDEVGEIDEVFEDGGDEEDIGDIPKGPIKSKNELVVLPPVPPVSVTLQPSHQILPVGVVVSTLGAQVVVEGSEKHSPLSEGSILWISDTRSPLGLVDEIFGPVKSPFYIVRFNTESEVPSGLRTGSLIGFVQEFVDHVLNDRNIYQKGYDASGENDEENMDEVEFSDDEKEAEYKRMLKMCKRGNDNQGNGNKKKNKKSFKNRERTWTKDQPSSSSSQSPTVGPTGQASMRVPPLGRPSFPAGPTSQANMQVPPSSRPSFLAGTASQANMPVPPMSRPSFPTGQANMPVPHLSRPSFPTGPTSQANMSVPPTSRPSFPTGQANMPVPPMSGPSFHVGPASFPQQAEQAGFLLNTLLANMLQFQQQANIPMPPGSFQMNGSTPWFHQNPQPQQMAAMAPQWPNLAPPQQQFDLSQLVPSSSALGQVNYYAGGPNMGTSSPWSGPGGLGQFPMVRGPGPSEPQGGPTFPMDADVRPPFNGGFSPGGGGRGRKSFHHPRGRGGRFDGRRGRH